MKNNVSIEWLEEVDSTMNEVLREEGRLGDLSVIAAVNQTAGRGQRGNKWLVEKGANLTFSILRKFAPGEFHVSRQFWLNEATALGICDYLANEGVDCSIKWPNDIYRGNKKICGTLIENALQGQSIVRSVIGIGLNVNQRSFPSNLVNPTSVSIVTGKRYSLDKELVKLCDCLLARYEDESLDSTKAEFEKRLFRSGQSHEYVDCSTGDIFTGTIEGVTDIGMLIVRTKKGELKEFAFKEISYII